MKMIAFLKSFFVWAFAILLIIVVILCVKTLNTNQIDNLFISFNKYQRSIIITSNNVELKSSYYLKNGNDFYHYFDNKNSVDLSKEEYIKAVVLYFCNDIDQIYFKNILGGNISKPSLVEGRVVYYGYTEMFPNYYLIKGKKINVQIAQTEIGWVTGFPAILTGF